MVGLLLIISAQVFYAIGALLLKKYLGHYNPVLVTVLTTISAAIFFLPGLFLFKSQIVGLRFKELLPFVCVGILALVVAGILYNAGFQKTLSLRSASFMTLFFPLFSTILGIIFLNEPFEMKAIAAGILMIAGFIILVV